jgi:hypothetical protein
MIMRHLIHSRYKFVTLVVLAMCLLSSSSVSAGDNKFEFANAFGVNGQRWARIWDTYVADGKVGYIVSEQSIFRQDKLGSFEELRIDESVIAQYGIPDQVAVDVRGRIYVTHKLNISSGVWQSTLIRYDLKGKVKQATSLGIDSFEDLEIINGTTVTGLVRTRDADGSRLFRICDIRNGQKTWISIPIDYGQSPRRYKVHNNRRWLAFSESNVSTIVPLSALGFDKTNEVLVGPNDDWGQITDFSFAGSLLVCVNGSRVVIFDGSGVKVKRFDSNDDPKYNNISYDNLAGYSDGSFLVSHFWGSMLRLDSAGEVVREYGGYGTTLPLFPIDIAGTAVGENEVWIPVEVGIQVLGQNERLFRITDSQGNPANVGSLANYEDDDVYVTYTSGNGYESGVAIISSESYKVKKRINVVRTHHYYGKVFVLERKGKPVLFVQTPLGLVCDETGLVLPSGYGELKQAGNSLLVRTENGFIRIYSDGRVSTKTEFAWLITATAPSYAFLSDGSYTDGYALFDYKGTLIRDLETGTVNGVVAVGKDRLLLHINEYVSVILKYK